MILLAFSFSVVECQDMGTSDGAIYVLLIFGSIGAGAALCCLFYRMYYYNDNGTYKRRPGCGSDAYSIDLAGREDDNHHCYLCLMTVPTSQWKSGEHRRLCAVENAELLKNLKTIDMRCQQCRQCFRLWPKIGYEFYCSGYSCSFSE